jgi:predicted Rossmann fold flavoprotein
MIKIAVLGGGPAGILAAYSASLNPNAQIDIYERNKKLGKKLYITGKGRCNLTNSGDAEDFFNAITRNRKFFYSAFYTFDNYALMSLIESSGVKLKSERGKRVFPESDKSSDVLRALNKLMEKENISVHLNTMIDSARKSEGKFYLDDINTGYDKLIIAGGGKSYPVTGSDGTAYGIAESFGHKIATVSAGLCGMETTDFDTKQLSGLGLKNVTLTVTCNGKKIYSDLGEMEFTHMGVSGPLVLTASSLVGADRLSESVFTIDLKPGLDCAKLDARILRDIAKSPNKEIKNSLGGLLPQRLTETIFVRCGISDDKKGNQLTKEERVLIVENIKAFSINPIRLRPLDEAIITRGGIKCSEVNPSTMESKLIEGLYFAGEILDLDALTGGFNLQIAFSTGYLAGMSTAQS